MTTQSLQDKLRAWPWLVFALITTAVVFLVAPQQVGLLAWALAKLAWGAYLGYWIDRGIFGYARPHEAERKAVAEDSDNWRMAAAVRTLRRALIVGSSIVALGLGV